MVEERLVEEALVVVEPVGLVGDGLLPHLARLLAQAHPTAPYFPLLVGLGCQ